jgi:filamentous hemagglutinin family protein
MRIVLLAVFGAAPPAGAEIATDGSLGPALEIDGPQYEIPASLGRQNGGNLFHSFSFFDIGSGERATFSDAGAIGPVERVLSRVTGGEPSEIHGTLRSTIEGADLYFLNPAGVIFGPDARLDLRGSFHVSTADALEFPNGERFEARAGAQTPLLAVSHPEAFGFLHESPAPIEIDGSQLAVREGHSLSFVGGDLRVRGRTFVGSGVREIVAPSGRLDLVSVGSAGRVVLPEAPDAPPVLEGFSAAGDLSFDGGWASTRGASGGGRIFLRGGEIVLARAAVESDSRSAGHAGSVDVEADSLRVVDGLVGAFATNFSTGDGGTIAIRAGEVRVESVAGDSRIDARSAGPGAAGSIEIEAGFLSLAGRPGTQSAKIDVGSTGTGGGQIRVAADRVELANARLDANEFGDGSGGGIEVFAGELQLVGSTFDAATFAGGPGGNVHIEADRIVLRAGSGLFANTVGAGNAGTVEIAAGELELEGSQVSARSFAVGPAAGGNVHVVAGRVTLVDSRMEVHTLGSSPAGTIEIAAEDVSLLRSALDAPTFGSGPAGSVTIDADQVSLDTSGVFANSVGAGDAGSVEIVAGELELEGSQVSARSFAVGPAAGGNVHVVAGRVSLVDSRMEVHTLGDDEAGSIEIDAGRFSVREGSQILARSEGLGSAGLVDIDAGEIEILGSNVEASGSRAGPAGQVVLAGERIRIAGGGEVRARALDSGDAGSVTIAATESIEISGDDTDVDASSRVGGRVGSIEISAPDVLVDDHARVSAAAFVPGEPGRIRIAGERIAIRKSGIVSTSPVAGPAGAIEIEASESVIVSNAGGDPLSLARLNAERVPGPAGIFASNVLGDGASGSVTVSAPLVRVEDGGIIATSTLDLADAGSVSILAERVEVLRGGLVDSSSSGAGDAGAVRIDATGSILVAGSGTDGVPSRVRSFAAAGGDGGNIALSAPRVVLSGGAVATTTVGEASTGSGGAIAIDAGELRITDGGRIDSGSFGVGDGGEVSLAVEGALEVTGAGSGVFAETGGVGVGGALAIGAGSVRIADGGALSSRAGSGVAGVAPVFADAIAGGFIPEPRSQPGDTPGLAGDIRVDAGRIELAGGTIDSQATTGQGGNIELLSTGPIVLANSSVTASVGSGSGGNVAIDPPLVVLDASRIVAQAGSGEGGRIAISADLLLVSTDSEISASAGVGIEGRVDLDAPDVDLAASLTALPDAPLETSGLLRERCASVRSDAVGSFVVRGREAAPAADPEGLLLALVPVPPVGSLDRADADAPALAIAAVPSAGFASCASAKRSVTTSY